MSKNILFCADGTWNGPGEPDSDDKTAIPTNVFKLFLNLDGRDTADTYLLEKEQERVLTAADGTMVQHAKYLHGVGDSDNLLVKAFGGALGAGLITRIVRGYTYVSRNYVAGDTIFIVGFSRGAYTARALAGLIATKGLLDATQLDLTDKEMAYRLCGRLIRMKRIDRCGLLIAAILVLACCIVAPTFAQRDEAATLNARGNELYQAGKYAEAEPLYKRALEIREKALGPDHPDVAQSLNGLAELYRAQGRYAEAEPLFKRALAIFEKALGPDHPDVAQSLNGLAELYRAQGRSAEAEPFFKRALAIFEKALGPDQPAVRRR
jgi:tetratricopeptide (TPR) repeat protein